MPKSRKELKRLVSVFNPRAINDWSKDESKFGQRMLEKMGWQKGQGLGSRNQGITENVKVRLKLDSRGLGFKITDNQWVEVENGFADVLSQLNKESSIENNSTKKTNSLVSKSVTSKSRVHYHKFTRGKDVSRYNINDLAGILGQMHEDLNCSDTIEEHQNIVQDTVQADHSNRCTEKCVVIAEDVRSDNDVLKKYVSKKQKKRKCASSNSETIVPSYSSVTDDVGEKKKSCSVKKKHKNQNQSLEDDCSTTELQNSERKDGDRSSNNVNRFVPHSQVLNSKAERIREKHNLLRRLQTDSIPHSFSGSNLANIPGYGSHNYV